MFEARRMRFRGPRYAVVGITILLLLTVTRSLVAAAFDGASSYSGDDDYDPAAGGRPELSLVVTSTQSSINTGSRFGGDDDYDPAVKSRTSCKRSSMRQAASRCAWGPTAGGRPQLPAVALTASVASPAGCGLSKDEIVERSAMTVVGGFSGDDDYDPAAGGTPELSLLAFANTPNLKAACEIANSDN